MNDIREWYYAQYGKSIGPISEIRLQELVQEGIITNQTYVWTEGFKDWIQYGEIAFDDEQEMEDEIKEITIPDLPASDEAKEEWFYVKNHQAYGPVSSEYLSDCIKKGKLKATNYIWKTGLKDWIPYNTSELVVLPELPKEETFWYYAEDGQSIGPISQTTFFSYIQKGIINENTYVWKKGMEDWKLFGEIEI